MLRLALAFAAVSLSALAADVPEVYYQGNLAPLNITPTFDKGYMVAYEGGAKVSLYAPDGSPAYGATAQVPGANVVVFENAAVDTNAVMVAAIRYQKAARYGGGIAFFDSTGRQTRFLDTSPYLPTQVCFAPDHSIWTLGWEWPYPDKPEQDYAVLRNYSQQGAQIGAFLPRSSFEPGIDPVGAIVGAWEIRIANGRIGAVLYASSVAGPEKPRRSMNQWIEVDLKGNVLGRWDFSSKHIAAFAGNGDVYAEDHSGISLLNHSSGSWRPVSGMPAGLLVGADGSDLVFLTVGNSRVRRVSLPQ